MSALAQMAQQLSGSLKPWQPIPEAQPVRAHKYDVRAERRRREIVAFILSTGGPVTRHQVEREFKLSAPHSKKLLREMWRDGVLERRRGAGRVWLYWVAAC